MPAVSLSPIFNGYQGFTIGGLPNAGGFINTFLAGTSKPSATYTTVAGDVPNATSIQLDSNGRPPFEIWLVQGQAYKFVLTDFLGLNAVTYDNISGVSDQTSLLSFIATLATAAGSALVGFIQAGVGAVLRTMQAKARDTVSVLDFAANGVSGAAVDPTGVLDSTLGIIAAITASKDVVIPPGTFKVSAPIPIPADHRLRGAGKGITFLRPTGTYLAAIQAIGANYASWLEGVVVEGIEIDGSNGFTGVGLYVKYVGLRSRFSDLYIHSITGKGLYTEGSFDHNYERIECRGNSGLGIHNFEKQLVPDGVYEESSKLVFTDCWSLENNSGGLQWQCDGGDTYSFNECKPSEGTVGLAFTKNCLWHRVNNLMFDGPSAGVGIAIQVNAQFAQFIFINNVRGFQNQYDVEIIHGQNIYVQQVTNVRTESSADGAVYLGPNISYVDTRTAQQTYPSEFISNWSPTLNGSGTAIGNGNLFAKYNLHGHRVFFDFELTAGTTTSLGSGFGFTVPITASSDSVITCTYYDVSTSTYYGTQAYLSSPINVVIPIGTAFMGGGIPVAIGTGDIIRATGSYQIN